MKFVSYRSQLNNSSCVPTCIGMLMASFGVEVAQSEIDEVSLVLGNGIYGSHKGAKKILKYYGFGNAVMKYVKNDVDVAKLFLKETLAISPIVVTGRFHHHPELNSNSGHAILAIGLTDNIIIYHDPHHKKAVLEEGDNRTIDIDEFINKWSVQHLGWALWINAKQ